MYLFIAQLLFVLLIYANIQLKANQLHTQISTLYLKPLFRDILNKMISVDEQTQQRLKR